MGLLQLHRIVFAGTDITGSDFNKVYKDELYNYQSKTTDPSKKSFSSTFFLLPANGNKVVDQWVARSWQGIQSIIAASTSVGGALQGSFAELQSNNWFDKSATFVGAFRDASDDWTAGWANFDPENTIY